MGCSKDGEGPSNHEEAAHILYLSPVPRESFFEAGAQTPTKLYSIDGINHESQEMDVNLRATLISEELKTFRMGPPAEPRHTGVSGSNPNRQSEA